MVIARNPDPKGQIIQVFSYMWMLAFHICITILITTEVRYRVKDQGIEQHLPRKGKQNNTLLWQDKGETKIGRLNREGNVRKGDIWEG